MQASAATAVAAAEAVAMESSDSESSTEDDDAQPNNGRSRLRKTSLSHVLLVASISAKVHRERMIWGSFLGGLTRSEFSRMFRMDHATFESNVLTFCSLKEVVDTFPRPCRSGLPYGGWLVNPTLTCGKDMVSDAPHFTNSPTSALMPLLQNFP